MPQPELGPRGQEFYDVTTSEFTFSPAELNLLTEVCVTLDTLHDLAAAVRRDGLVIAGSKGQSTVHPAVTEARGQRIALHRLLSALAIPDQDGKTIPTSRSASTRASNTARFAPRTGPQRVAG